MQFVLMDGEKIASMHEGEVPLPGFVPAPRPVVQAVIGGMVVFYWEGDTPPTPPEPMLKERLAAVKSYYDAKLAALDTSMINALWADGGTQEVTTRASLAAKRQKTLAERSAAIQALTQS